MVSNVKIVTDSTAYIKKEYAENNGIDIIPLSVEFCGEISNEGYPGEFKEFYNKLKSSNDFPKTSQPPIGAFVNSFEKAIEEGKEVVAILISSKLSGTYNSAFSAANIVNPEKVTVIDSETTVSNLRILVEKATELANKGKGAKEIASIINKEKKNMGISLTVNNLEYLKRGGRLSGTQALIGTILNIKPIIALIDGKLVSIDKVRGKSKAIEYLISRIPREVKNISINHILNEEEALKIQSMIREEFEWANININEIGPVIGSHLGPGAIGICYSW